MTDEGEKSLHSCRRSRFDNDANKIDIFCTVAKILTLTRTHQEMRQRT